MPKAIARIITSPGPFASLTAANDAGPVNADSPNLDGARTGKAHRLAALFDKFEAGARALHASMPVRLPSPKNPYVTHYGKVTDQPKYTAWEMARMAAERAARETCNGEAR